MIREIMTDTEFLKRPARRWNGEVQVIEDLRDTLIFHQNHCVGMAANMIGQDIAVIAVLPVGMPMPLILCNPQIIEKSDAFFDVEGCLSIPGERHVTRYRNIRVRWENPQRAHQEADFAGFAAQIIQHEMDHLKGILV